MPAATWPTHDVCPAIAGGGRATAKTGRDDRTPWPLSGSIIVHVLLVAILISIPQKRWAQSQPEKILVQILTPQQFEAATEPAVLQTDAETPQPVHATPSPDRFTGRPVSLPIPPKPKGTGMIKVTKILSGTVLEDPRSRQARLALRQLSDIDRREQLCNLEAMEQVQAWNGDYEPERLVAYAMADTLVTGNVVQADGAAFRSKRKWYNLKYRCEVTADLVTVTAFEFSVGDPIPRKDWDAHYLPARY